MAEIKGGITVSGGSVDSMPVILDGRTSLYTEAIERGLIEPDTTYEQFLERLAVKPGELNKVVKAAVAENLEKTVKTAVNAGLEETVNEAVAAAIAKMEANRPTPPAPQPTPQPVPQPTPIQPAAADISDDTLAEINKILGNTE